MSDHDVSNLPQWAQDRLAALEAELSAGPVEESIDDMPSMSHRDIRAWLRGATRARVLSGWYPFEDVARHEDGTRTMETRWVVNSAVGGVNHDPYTDQEVIEYCGMLKLSEDPVIEPEYRN